MKDEPKKAHAWVVHFFSGGVAGCVAKTVIAPLDRVKILFQTRHPSYPFSGIFNTLRLVTKNEGFFKLWKGNTATVARVFPYASIQFMAYEQYKKMIIPNKPLPSGDPSQHPRRVNPLLHLLCGSLAGTTAVMFTYPLDLMRARLASQVHEKIYKNVFHGLQTQVKNEGIPSLFKGMKATIEGIIPYAGVNFCVYETLKSYAPKNKDGELPTTWKLICGGIAGPIGQTVSYPWDVVRRRQQIWGFSPGSPQLTSQGTLATMQEIVQKEGIRGLYRGISINYLKATPTVGITFAVYELLKYYLLPHNQ